MSRVLAVHTHQVFTLPSSIGATRIILEKAIDVVVVDVHLPSIRGDKLVSLFRGNERMQTLGVVLVSDMDRAELDHLAREAGADGAVVKGDVPARLNDTILEAKKRRSG